MMKLFSFLLVVCNWFWWFYQKIFFMLLIKRSTASCKVRQNKVLYVNWMNRTLLTALWIFWLALVILWSRLRLLKTKVHYQRLLTMTGGRRRVEEGWLLLGITPNGPLDRARTSPVVRIREYQSLGLKTSYEIYLPHTRHSRLQLPQSTRKWPLKLCSLSLNWILYPLNVISRSQILTHKIL